jgi:hypothetical protein
VGWEVLAELYRGLRQIKRLKLALLLVPALQDSSVAWRRYQLDWRQPDTRVWAATLLSGLRLP